MQAGTYLLSTAYTPTRIMGILAGDEEQTGVTQDTATAADTAAQTDTQTTDAGTDTADTRVQMVQQILRQLMELQGRRVRTVIVEERMRTYINSLDMGNTPFLEELEKKHLQEGFPLSARKCRAF